MKTVLKLLRKELKEWKAEKVACNIFYENGARFPKSYIKVIKRADLHIQELKNSIKILNSHINN